ncbi:histone-like nucleoid-structuring protein Lsr2 [Streptomyces sp. NPDC056500]|uniref:Lsr2 family DNA-binding protein n=1 Tax=Streptomyces sp. NPDC056500 TaxID=3345840 RepID=UPI0036C3E8EB
MSETLAHEADEVGEAWGRITGWLEQNAPGTFADLGGPGTPTAISEAEERMGLKLPSQIRQWLLTNNVGVGRQPDAGSCLVVLGCAGVIPSGGLLLGLPDIERVHAFKMRMETMEPSQDPDYPSWRREWVPIVAERDGFYGTFLNAHTGSIGSWTESSNPEEEEFASLFAFLQDVADHLEGISPRNAKETATVHDRDPSSEAIRLWARANGYLVNGHGRIPASVRQAYEASQ